MYVVTVDAPTVGDIYQALNGINRQFDDPVTKTNMLKPGAPLTVHNRLENPDIGTLATAQSLDLGTLIFSGLGSSNPSAAPGIAALPEVVTASLDLATGNAASSAQIDSAATQIFVGPGATAAELNPNGGPIVSVDSWYSIQQDPNGGSLISVDVAVNDNAAVNVLNLVGTGPGSYGLDLTNRSTLVMSAGATGVEFIFPIADPTPGANEPIASGNTGPGIDFAHFEANYTVVPEPSSLFLLALAGLGLTRGRRGR